MSKGQLSTYQSYSAVSLDVRVHMSFSDNWVGSKYIPLNNGN